MIDTTWKSTTGKSLVPQLHNSDLGQLEIPASGSRPLEILLVGSSHDEGGERWELISTRQMVALIMHDSSYNAFNHYIVVIPRDYSLLLSAMAEIK